MQNNEAEALRSWRSALDQIYYHNAYRVPPNYRPKSETEKALQDSLRDMEMQCKERVDILEARRRSRAEVKDGQEQTPNNVLRRGRPPALSNKSDINNPLETQTGHGTIPAINSPNLSKPPPPALPPRPPLAESRPSTLAPERPESSFSTPHARSSLPYSPPPPPPPLTVPIKHISRTPSPDKKGRMLTTLRTKDGKKPSKDSRSSDRRNVRPPAASKAAGLAWDSNSRLPSRTLGQTPVSQNGSTATLDSPKRDSLSGDAVGRTDTAFGVDGTSGTRGTRPRTPELNIPKDTPKSNGYSSHDDTSHRSSKDDTHFPDPSSFGPPLPLAQKTSLQSNPELSPSSRSPSRPRAPVEPISYRTEYPPSTPSSRMMAEYSARLQHSGDSTSLPMRQRSPQRRTRPPVPSGITRHPVANSSTPRTYRQDSDESQKASSLESTDESSSRKTKVNKDTRKTGRKERTSPVPAGAPSRSTAGRDGTPEKEPANEWEARIQRIKKNLPKGVDENAAKQIFNEIVVSGDEVHWGDVAGLDVAKKALKEAVVYPFLRPDLFMGLREPARGMLLFGPPGTGKTMLARAVATESRSTFFAISASSLTSKWLGESEKLVRALFSLAKALAPSIIFVDEIDSLLSSRGGSSEHESTRRIKTEFLIQWSDLQRAAAGKQQSDKEKQEGDASRVLVLAATNMPWAIDEAARRRFVRRQYIPLPEAHVRESQLRTLLSHQKHNLKNDDIQVLVELTEGTNAYRT